MVNEVWVAANTGDLEAIKRLLAVTPRPDIESPDPLGRTALIEAAKYDHVDIVRELLLAGANPFREAMLGMAIHYTGNEEIQLMLASAMRALEAGHEWDGDMEDVTLEDVEDLRSRIDFGDEAIKFSVNAGKSYRPADAKPVTGNYSVSGVTVPAAGSSSQQQRHQSPKRSTSKSPSRSSDKKSANGNASQLKSPEEPDFELQRMENELEEELSKEFKQKSSISTKKFGQSPTSPSTSTSSPQSNQVCRFWLQGSCRRGAGCWYRHDQQAPNNGMPEQMMPLPPVPMVPPHMPPHMQPPPPGVHMPPPFPMGVPHPHMPMHMPPPPHAQVMTPPMMSIHSNTSTISSTSSAPSNGSSDQICRFFLQGNCRRGDQCWYKHAYPSS